jgi:prepilin-type N-terminal cleavage/methylation domain-containing protein
VRGFTLLEVMVVVLIITVIVFIAMPSYKVSSTTSRRTACIENLRLIDQAKEQLAMSKGFPNGTQVAWSDVVPRYINFFPICPPGGSYRLNSIGSDPSCSLAQIGHKE